MPDGITASQTPDTGLAALILILRFHGIAADPQQISHQYGNKIGVTEMLRCAKELQLKARIINSDWGRLNKTPYPVIAEKKDGGFFILGKVTEDTAIIQEPTQNRPEILPRSEFEEKWSGRLVFMTRQCGSG